MANNKTFFRSAQQGSMTLKDIFSDVKRKHTSVETARVFIAGTDLTTPAEPDMLSVWQKPFLFARFFVMGMIFLGLCLLFAQVHVGGYYYLLIGLSVIIPLVLLLLVWEMNVPRNISLYEVLLIVGLGGILSLIATIALGLIDPTSGAIWAPLTEEPAKLLIIYMVLRRKNYKYTLNGILIGTAVGTGFAVFENLYYTFNAFAGGGMLSALVQALVRALTDIPGHGLYAGLYGGALVMVKGAAPVSPTHLIDLRFLKYFGISFLMHMLNNSGLIQFIYAIAIGGSGGPLSSVGSILIFAVVMSAIMVACFLPMLRNGVNQAVELTLQYNGSLTQAVVRDQEPVPSDRHVPPAQAPAQVSAPRQQILLRFVAGPEKGKQYRIPEDRKSITIGRVAGSCDFPLPGCGSVSSRHCSLLVRGSSIVVTDLGSTNGTYIGSQRIAPHQPTSVSSGAVIWLGGGDCGFQILFG